MWRATITQVLKGHGRLNNEKHTDGRIRTKRDGKESNVT